MTWTITMTTTISNDDDYDDVDEDDGEKLRRRRQRPRQHRRRRSLRAGPRRRSVTMVTRTGSSKAHLISRHRRAAARGERVARSGESFCGPCSRSCRDAPSELSWPSRFRSRASECSVTEGHGCGGGGHKWRRLISPLRRSLHTPPFHHHHPLHGPSTTAQDRRRRAGNAHVDSLATTDGS